MSNVDFGQWQPMASAPKDGSKILLTLRSSEQGPAEVDTARWVKQGRSGEGQWIAADSDSDAVIVYAEAELLSWMPLPTPLPKLRSTQISPARRDPDEIGGSGI